MRKILVIARREYLAAVRTKAFLIGLLFMPIMIFGSVAVEAFLKHQVDPKAKRFAVIDRTPGQQMFPILGGAAKLRSATKILDSETKNFMGAPFIVERIEPGPDTPEALEQQRFELSERVRNGEFYGFLEIGADVLRPFASVPGVVSKALAPLPADRLVLRYQSNRPMYLDFSRWAEHVISSAVQLQRGTEAGLSLDKASAVIQPVPLQAKGLSHRDPSTGQIQEAIDDSPLSAVLLPMSLTVLMLMMLMVGTSPLMQGVIEEKMQRIAEVLLGSVRPFNLMLGKLLGMVGVSLTTVSVYLVGAFWAAERFGFHNELSAGLIGWFLLFQLLGVVMYGSLFIAIGAACTDAKEAQTLLMPVMLLASAPVFALTHILRDPTSTFSTWLSLVPFATPMLMTARIAIPPGVPSWQPILGVVLVLATTTVCVYCAGRIFRVGLLMQGKGARLRDLVKWIVRG
jgi:ABC-2 type transport system permease protein